MSGIRRRWQMKPPLGTQINPGHPLSSGLVGCWQLAEFGGTTVNDSSYYGNGNASVSPPAWVSGSSGPALHCDNTNSQSITVISNPNISFVSGLTIQCKFFLDSSRDYNALVTKTLTNSAAPFDSYVDGSGFLSFYVGAQSLTSNTHVAASKWWDFVGVALPNDSIATLSLYLNGLIESSGSSVISIDDTGKPIIFGSRDDGATMLGGRIDYVRIWDRALTAVEVSQLYSDPHCFMNPPGPRRIWSVPSAGTTLTCSVFN